MAHQCAYKVLGEYLSTFASNTFMSNVISTRGNKYFQLFYNRGNFVTENTIPKKRHARMSLDRVIRDIGIISELLTDGPKEIHLGEWGKTCRRYRIYQQLTGPHSSWQNPTELHGGIIKRRVKRTMRKTNTPLRLWDYSWEYECAIRYLTATYHIKLDGVTPFEKIHGYTPNIAEYLQHKWFEWVWYYNPADPNKKNLEDGVDLIMILVNVCHTMCLHVKVMQLQEVLLPLYRKIN